MLKLSLPAKAGLFDALVDHPKVLRVVALSGGFSRAEACVELAKNRGIIASFSRALLNDLRHQMSENEFNASLGQAIEEIYTASTKKAAWCEMRAAGDMCRAALMEPVVWWNSEGGICPALAWRCKRAGWAAKWCGEQGSVPVRPPLRRHSSKQAMDLA